MNISRLFFLLFSLIIIGCIEYDQCPYTPRTPPEPVPNILRFLSYNTYFLINSTKGTPWKTQKEVSQHYDDILKSLSTLSHESSNYLNIIGLQSIEGCSVLKEIKGKLSAYNFSPYQRFIINEEQQVGVLSQIRPSDPGMIVSESAGPYPLPDSKCNESGITGFSSLNFTTIRRHSYASFVVNGLPFLVFNIHLTGVSEDILSTSNENINNCYIRESETRLLVKEIQELVERATRKTTVIILGTFNDFDPFCPGKNEHATKSRVFDWITKELGTYNVLSSISKQDRVSFYHNEKGYLLDTIMISDFATEAIFDSDIHNEIFLFNKMSNVVNGTYHVPISLDINLEKLHSIVFPKKHDNDDGDGPTYYWIIPVVVSLFVFGIYVCGVFCCCCIICILCMNGFTVVETTRRATTGGGSSKRNARDYMFMGEDDIREKQRLKKSTSKQRKKKMFSRKKNEGTHFKVESFKVI